tara:strand:- start:179 stop:1045 length:867 start_codon:yes stop_codon:yes gene_type:complete
MSETDESVEVEASESTEASAPEAEAAPAIEPAFEWNGEVESMQSADWFSSLDEPVRQGLLNGIQQKYQNWEKGYSTKFQEMAQTRKSFADREAEIRAQEQRVVRWLHGEGDPLEESRQEISRLKTQQEAAIGALRSEYEQALQNIQDANAGELRDAVKSRDEALAKMQDFEQQRAAAEEAALETQVDEIEQWLEKEAPDVMGNDDAFYTWCVLCTGGVDPEDAVSMVRAKYAPPAAPEPEPEPEAPSKAVELMNMGGGTGNTESGQPKTFEDIMDEMRRAAQQGAFRR